MVAHPIYFLWAELFCTKTNTRTTFDSGARNYS